MPLVSVNVFLCGMRARVFACCHKLSKTWLYTAEVTHASMLESRADAVELLRRQIELRMNELASDISFDLGEPVSLDMVKDWAVYHG